MKDNVMEKVKDKEGKMGVGKIDGLTRIWRRNEMKMKRESSTW